MSTGKIAFNDLHATLTSAPVLAYPDFSKPFIMETNTCDKGLGVSRDLHGVQRNMKNYSFMKLELLALKWAVAEKFWKYLLGSGFVVYTDNNSLTYLQSKSKLKAVEQRWAAELASFNYKIEYHAGKHNANTDA